MQVQSDSQPYDSINITPMLDLAYVLLVIFIIMTTATVQGIKANLPKASAAPSINKQETVAILVRSNGQLVLGSETLTLPELETRLRQRKTADPDFPVLIKGEDQAQYKQVIAVLDLMGKLDIKKVALPYQQVVQ